MNPASPLDPRQEMEARIVALLLGEASPFEEAQLLRAIEQDPQLAAFYRDLQKTVGLLREVARPSIPSTKEAAAAAPPTAAAPKLSPARRAALMAALQTPSPAPAGAEKVAAASAARPANVISWSKIWRRLRQPIGPQIHWAWSVAAVLALVAITGSLMLPSLGTVRARSQRVSELNRQKMLELERALAEGNGDIAAAPDVLHRPADTPVTARFANHVFLPSANVEGQPPAHLSDRADKLGDHLAIAAGPPAASQAGQLFYFDADAGELRRNTRNRAESRDAKDATRGDGLTGLAAANQPGGPPAAAPAGTVAETPASQLAGLGLAGGQPMPNNRAEGLASNGTLFNSLDNLQRQYFLADEPAAPPPQQNLAFETGHLGQPQPGAAEQFWRDLPNVNIVVNTEQSLGRTPTRLELDYAGVQLQESRATREHSATETTRKRLAEENRPRELERLARQTAEDARADDLKSAAGGIPVPATPPAPVALGAKTEEKAAEAKKELLREQLENAKLPSLGTVPVVGGRFNAPPAPPAAGKPASDEALDKRKAGASLPPLIHPAEIQTAPNSTVNFSTFSLNVSDVSFKTAAASLQAGQWPDPNSIRVEEFINAFNYRDPAPAPGARLAFHWEIARHPFAHQRDLLRFSIQTAALGRQAAQPLNLVVLLDNSGSMGRPDRVAIVGQALQVLGDKLQPQDKLSVVAFARRPQLCVDGQPGQQAKAALQRVLQLNPEGGTDLGAGLDVAYQTALKHFHPQANNRVLLLTDGAANLGDVDPEALKQKVVAHRQKGVALDCFGVGWEGLDDELLELLSRNGDGRYALLNEVDQAALEFAEKLAGALNVAAADVKTQVEFNPYRVTAYRQIGYARHQLTKEQFRDNTVDAAELAAAEAGNAMYVVQVNAQGTGPLGVVRVRYRIPATGEYEEREWVLAYQPQPPPLEQASPAMRLAATAALFGEYLSRNPYAGEIQLKSLAALAGSTVKAFEPDPRPQQLLTMLQQAMRLEGGR